MGPLSLAYPLVMFCFLVHPGAVVLNADKARLGPASVRQLVQYDFR